MNLERKKPQHIYGLRTAEKIFNNYALVYKFSLGISIIFGLLNIYYFTNAMIDQRWLGIIFWGICLVISFFTIKNGWRLVANGSS